LFRRMRKKNLRHWAKLRKNIILTINLFNTCTKVNLLWLFEKVYNIERLDFNFTKISMTNNLTIDEINLITKVYRSTKSDLSTIENIIKSYVNMITHICGDLPIIISSQKGK